MAEKWRELEENCLEYLREHYGEILFVKHGESDSTLPDIGVVTPSKNFFIEVKSSVAQSGQFVLIPDDEKGVFIFSPLNKSSENDFTDKIIDFMNENFDDFHDVGTSAITIGMNKDTFAKWITDYYGAKNVKYFMTYDNETNQYVIFPLKNFIEYFSVEANYRRKASGSRHVSKKNVSVIKDKIISEYPNTKFEYKDGKLYVSGVPSLKNKKFNINDVRYMIREKDGELIVKVLSNTKNPNVIFSVSLLKSQDEKDLKEFEEDLI